MSTKRPSQEKVVGVSVRYLNNLYDNYHLQDLLNRFTHEPLNQFEAMRVMGHIASSALINSIKSPIQHTRRSFLWREQQAEGFAVGEESISVFAQHTVNNYLNKIER